jgi:hypothetical protein
MGDGEFEDFCRYCADRALQPRLFSIEFTNSSPDFLTELVMSVEYFNDICVDLVRDDNRGSPHRTRKGE